VGSTVFHESSTYYVVFLGTNDNASSKLDFDFNSFTTTTMMTATTSNKTTTTTTSRTTTITTTTTILTTTKAILTRIVGVS
jgi:hypothetical protein